MEEERREETEKEAKGIKRYNMVVSSILYNKCSILNDERTIDWVYPITSV